VSGKKLSRFHELVESSWIKDELWKVRNFHQGFEHGFWAGMLHTGLQMITGGRGFRNRYPNVAGHERMIQGKGKRSVFAPNDKLNDVYHSGTAHDENQPCHLIVVEPNICHPRCTTEYGNPCQNFCPAAVYEMQDDKLQINFSNCVHCKTCDIMDPYQVINWTTPEGGGGPGYDLL
jgi:electron-transferring-flavoprotein dehydrogenase